MAEPTEKDRELAYYKARLDELAGDALRLDYEISGLRKELKQKRQAFTLLARLQHGIGAESDLERVFELVVEEATATLGLDGTVVLVPCEGGRMRPTRWQGPAPEGRRDELEERMSRTELEWPPELLARSALFLASRESPRTEFVERISRTFGLPFFVAVPVFVEDTLTAVLLAGRIRETGSLYPPLDHSDVETFQAIAALIARFAEARRIGVLREVDRLKSHFFANISHEFRTPITLTLGPLEGILAGRYGEVPEEVREQGRIIERSQYRLLRLVDEILKVARVEAGQLPLRASRLSNPNRFLQDRLAPFREAARSRGLALDTWLDPRADSGMDLYADLERLEELLSNLLSNALKFTRQGHIEVGTRVDDGSFRLSVTDTGVGIEASELPHVFDRFRRVGEQDGTVGTGLGLAWVKEICELHGGSVEVESAPGVGSTFTATFPLGREHLEASSIVEFDEATLPDIGSMFRAYVVAGGNLERDGLAALNGETLRSADPFKATLVYVEDNADLGRYVRDLLADEFNVLLAGDGQEGLETIRRHRPDLVIADQMMPRMSGDELVRCIRSDPELEATPVVILTALSGTTARVASLERGADDYVSKPFDAGELRARVRNLVSARAQERELREANRALEARLEEQLAVLSRKREIGHLGPRAVAESLISRSEAMRNVLDLTGRIAGASSTVLISGETGTGKEVIARAIHARSAVAEGPFVAVHCASLPPGLLESELFGHERGAFTGATSRRRGRFELAHGGTLFLDEVGEIGPEAQVKLLRVLQERSFERVGGNETVTVSVRIVAATNRDLAALVRQGSFREDLFFRLNVIPLELPPLRERSEDIPLLVSHFLDQYRRRLGRPPMRVAPGAMRLLCAYGWPGNVREIQNVMERLAVTVGEDVVGPPDLPPEIRMALWSGPAGEARADDENAIASLEENERAHILRALEASNGVIRGDRGAATLLGLPESTLRYRMRKLGLKRKR